jgi:hypothetical protein
MRIRLHSQIPFLLLLAISYVYLMSENSLAQSNDEVAHTAPRIVRVGPDDPSFPIGRLTILYDGAPVKYGTPFNAPDDWLKHVSVAFQNKSSKPLTAGTLQIDFRQLGGDPIAIYYVHFGRTPEHQLHARSGQPIARPAGESPIAIAPGATATISFGHDFPAMRSVIETRGTLSQLTYCHIEYGAFYFDTDLRWMRGAFTRADPNTPGQYVPANAKEFTSKP